MKLEIFRNRRSLCASFSFNQGQKLEIPQNLRTGLGIYGVKKILFRTNSFEAN